MNNVFKHSIKARPTTYNGIDFRSELEASWACFFDIRNISYDYEPLVNLAAWRPDFQITLAAENLESDPGYVLTEVKPYLTLENWKQDADTVRKISKSFVGGFLVVLLGSSPLVPANFMFGIDADSEVKFDPISFGDDDKLTQEEWTKAKNAVRWRPSV